MNFRPLLFIGCIVIFCPFTARSSEFSPFERNVLAELNRARTNPQDYAKTVEALLNRFEKKRLRLSGGMKINTKEGPKAVKQAVKALKKTSPLPALRSSEGLSQAANRHVIDQGPSGKTGHSGTKGQTLTQRVAPFGTWQKKLGENISYGMPTATDVIVQLLVDDGVKGRGHRKNILDPGYATVGVACGPHKRYRTMCVTDFAGEFLEN